MLDGCAVVQRAGDLELFFFSLAILAYFTRGMLCGFQPERQREGWRTRPLTTSAFGLGDCTVRKSSVLCSVSVH